MQAALCRRWRDHHDILAVRQQIGIHASLVIETAPGYGGFGLPLEDLIGEGYVGLMHAVCRFDPDRDVRFATYATWWMRASIHEYIVRNCSFASTDPIVPEARRSDMCDPDLSYGEKRNGV